MIVSRNNSSHESLEQTQFANIVGEFGARRFAKVIRSLNVAAVRIFRILEISDF